MRIASKLLVLGILTLCLVGVASAQVSAEKAGLTLSPATVTLRLAEDSADKKADFTITNHYEAPITLSFIFEPRAGEPSDIHPSQYLLIGQTNITLGAGETAVQTIILKDTDKLSPGSQLADLIISQSATSSGNIGVMPNIRMPLVIIKEDGAVSAITLAQFVTPKFGLAVPDSLSATIHNSGNMIAMPRGTITISAPNGTVVRQGALNTSSFAVTPGKDITLITPLNKLGNAFWPGIYRTTLSYGLGGGQANKAMSGWFFYIAWWHVAILVALSAAGYLGIKYAAKKHHKKPRLRHLTTKRAMLTGRDTA